MSMHLMYLEQKLQKNIHISKKPHAADCNKLYRNYNLINCLKILT